MTADPDLSKLTAWCLAVLFGIFLWKECTKHRVHDREVSAQDLQLRRDHQLQDERLYLVRNDNADDTETFMAAASEEAHDRYMQFLVARDRFGMASLREAGLVVSLPELTRVRVIEGGVLLSEVRVETGEHAGELLWVASEVLWR